MLSIAMAMPVDHSDPGEQLRAGHRTDDPSRPWSGVVALLIEEDSLVRAAMCLVLTGWGLRVLDVPSLLVAERAVTSAGVVPGIVLTALNVGGSADSNDAFDLLPPILARIGVTGPVVVTTGDTSPERSERIAALGWTRLVKPFRPDTLRAVLAECLPVPRRG